MSEDIMSEIRQGVEGALTWRREKALPGQRWMNVHSPSEPAQSAYDVLQVYLLLKILDRLESIDESLTSMSNEIWEDHHNK